MIETKMPSWIRRIAFLAATVIIVISAITLYVKLYFWGGTRYAPIYVKLGIWFIIFAGPLAVWQWKRHPHGSIAIAVSQLLLVAVASF